MQYTVALLCLILIGGSYAQTQGTLGQATPVSANAQTSISYGLALTGPTLVITAAQPSSVTLSTYTAVSASAGLPQGYNSINLGLNLGVGFVLAVNNTGSITATLTTAAVTLNLGSSTQVGVLQLGGSSYNYIAANFDSTSNTISFPLPSAGTYVLVTFNQGASIPTFFGAIQQLVSGTQTQLNYTAAGAGTLLINVTTNANTNITVTYSDDNDNDEPEDYDDIDVYFNIETSSGGNVVSNATLRLTYNDTLVNAANFIEDSLAFAFWNVTAAQWQFVAGGSIDTTNNVIVQPTSHFSTWGVFGKKKDDGSPSSAAALLPVVATALLAALV